jgi:Glycosyl hydrolase family 76
MARIRSWVAADVSWAGTPCVYQIECRSRLFCCFESMISTLPHRRTLRALCCSLLACLGGLLLLASLAHAAKVSGAGSKDGAGGHGGSTYPAAATRPFLRPSPRQYAHAAASRGGALAPSSSTTNSSSSSSSKTTKAKKKKAKPGLTGNPARALLAFQTMQKIYYIPGSGLYDGEPFSYLWPFSQALAATVTMANIPHSGVSFAHELQAEMVGLNSYLDTDNSGAPEGVFTSTLTAFDGTVAPPAGPGGAKYYDDNDWIGIELARLYELDRNPSALGNAEAIMNFEMAGWQTSPELGCPGGIPFSNSVENSTRNTITTAPAAELGLQLYRITGNVSYLQFAEMAYQWVRSCLLQPSGLYADHLNKKGVIEPTLWSYNQGVMIGAGTLLYQATGNSAYLYQARQTAKAAQAYFTPERLGGENPFFPSVYFRNIMYLDSVTHDPPGPKIAQAYVNYAWLHLRLSNDLFVAGSPASAQLLYQAAIVQIYALLSSPPSTYF